MAGRRLLLAATLGVALALASAVGPARADIDLDWDVADGQVDAKGTESTAGKTDRSGPSAGVVGGDGEAQEPQIIYDPRDNPNLNRCDAEDFVACAPKPPPADPAAPVDPGVPAVTLSDIASFVPTPPVHGMQPDGWAVSGLPANFVAEASVHVVGGTLLGRPAEVRFTPIGFEWQFGDGGSLRSASGGTPWNTEAGEEFTPTATSHVYATPGTYSTTTTVLYGAEYRFAGSDWRPIAGALTVASAPRPIVVGDFDTVLVDGDCVANPASPGC